MKLQFKNASLVSVINGSVVIKDYAGRKHTFTNASVISVNNGIIVIETEWGPKRGELVKVINTSIDIYCLFDKIEDDFIYVFGWKKIDCNQHYLKNDCWMINSQTKISPVTQEEQKEFDDFCKSQGIIWNKEILQWEKYKWKPADREMYFTINVTYSGIYIVKNIWRNGTVDQTAYNYSNCFKTRKEAEIKLNKIKNLFKE